MQCGEFVNRFWGLPAGGSNGFGDSPESKINMIKKRGVFVEDLNSENYNQILKPGMAFVSAESDYYHVGVVTKVGYDQGIFETMEANIRDNDVNTPDIPKLNQRSIFDSNIIGFVYPPENFKITMSKEGLLYRDTPIASLCPELTTGHQKNLDKRLVLGCYDPIYEKYTEEYKIQRLVSAIHFAEKGHGGRCAKDCSTSHAGAQGPMQFMPKTFEAYKCDGMDDPNNLDHSVCAGTNYLTALYNKEQENNPTGDVKAWLWVSAYRYNAGYSRPATRDQGIPAGVQYADTVLEEMEKMATFI